MVAQAEFSLRSSRNLPAHIRLYGPDAGMALLVVLVGTMGLITHSWVRQVVEAWINIHLLFGLLLCGWVIVRHRLQIKESPCMFPSDVRRLARQQSRLVYAVLYAVIAVKQSIGVVSFMRHGGAADFSLFDERILNGPDARVFDPKDDFQLFLASGVVALVVVRVMAFRVWLRLTEHPLASVPSEPGGSGATGPLVPR
jgi:cytochrome b561